MILKKQDFSAVTLSNALFDHPMVPPVR